MNIQINCVEAVYRRRAERAGRRSAQRLPRVGSRAVQGLIFGFGGGMNSLPSFANGGCRLICSADERRVINTGARRSTVGTRRRGDSSRRR